MNHIKDEIKKVMDIMETLLASKKDWNAYKRVQMSGAYNMLTPQARELSGLDEDVYFDIIKNYSAYEKAYSVDA